VKHDKRPMADHIAFCWAVITKK